MEFTSINPQTTLFHLRAKLLHRRNHRGCVCFAVLVLIVGDLLEVTCQEENNSSYDTEHPTQEWDKQSLDNEERRLATSTGRPYRNDIMRCSYKIGTQECSALDQSRLSYQFVQEEKGHMSFSGDHLPWLHFSVQAYFRIHYIIVEFLAQP